MNINNPKNCIFIEKQEIHDNENVYITPSKNQNNNSDDNADNTDNTDNEERVKLKSLIYDSTKRENFIINIGNCTKAKEVAEMMVSELREENDAKVLLSKYTIAKVLPFVHIDKGLTAGNLAYHLRQIVAEKRIK